MLKLKKENSIIHTFLVKANVPFTGLGLKETIMAHPEAGTLLAVGDILDDYNIENISVRITPEELCKIDTPFISQLQTPEKEFVLITTVGIDKIEYVNRHGRSTKLPFSEFREKWSGIALMTEVTGGSREKGYALNRVRNILSRVRLPFVITSLFLMTVYWGIYRNLSQAHGTFIACFVLLLSGAIVTTLLVIQSVAGGNSFVHRLCNISRLTRCNDILESSAASIGGVVSWSEVGWVYFTGSLLSMSFAPGSLPVLQLINICALPYTCWSIYYQWKIAKQWCPFCISIQLLLWSTFILSTISLHGLGLGSLTFDNCLATAVCFLTPVTFAWLTFPFIKKAMQAAPLRAELHRIKTSEAFFKASLAGQEKVSFEGYDQDIVFGDPHAPYEITVVSNPYCSPCARMHQRVNDLLSKLPARVKLRYVFAVAGPDNEERDQAIKYLIAAYHQYGQGTAEEIYSMWYSADTVNFDRTFARYPVKMDDPVLDAILASHSEWCRRAGITATPTVYLNGSKLPGEYELEDLKHFIRV